jgi:hypothetical protein
MFGCFERWKGRNDGGMGGLRLLFRVCLWKSCTKETCDIQEYTEMKHWWRGVEVFGKARRGLHMSVQLAKSSTRR